MRETALRKADKTDRYRFFEQKPDKGIHIVFDWLKEGRYMVNEYIIKPEARLLFFVVFLRFAWTGRGIGWITSKNVQESKSGFFRSFVLV